MEHRRGRARAGAASPVQDDDVIGEQLRLLCVVGDVNHRQLQLVAHAQQVRQDPSAKRQIDSSERLVEEQERGRSHERARERDPLSLSAGETADAPSGVDHLPEEVRGPTAAAADVEDRAGPGKMQGAQDPPIELGSVEKGATVKADAQGTLTVHGVAKPVTIPVEARWNGNTIEVVGTTPIVLADYGISAPSTSVVSVEDNGSMELKLTFAK